MSRRSRRLTRRLERGQSRRRKFHSRFRWKIISANWHRATADIGADLKVMMDAVSKEDYDGELYGTWPNYSIPKGMKL